MTRSHLMIIATALMATALLGATLQWRRSSHAGTRNLSADAFEQRQKMAASIFDPTKAPDKVVQADPTPPRLLPFAGPTVKNQLAAVAASSFEDRLAAVIGEAGNKSYRTRHNALLELPLDLTSVELETLQNLLLQKNVPGLNVQQMRAFKNDVLNLLRRQTTPPAGLSQTLISLYRDKEQDPGLRDYAIQHLATWYDRSDSSQQPSIRQALLLALNETDSSISGTALLGLYRLTSVDHPEITREALGSTALTIASDPATGELTRITAVQISSQYHEPRLLPVATALVHQGAVSMPLRIAAVAAIGDVGGDNDVLLLEQLAGGSEQRLQIPAKSALLRLHQRLNH